MVCKLNNQRLTSRRYVRFILTMWYVNTDENSLTNQIADGFILTMWYVNWGYTKFWVEKIICFILTMWYVNPSAKTAAPTVAIVLY